MTKESTGDPNGGNAEPNRMESVSLISEAVELSGPSGKRRLRGVLLSVGEKKAKTGTIKVNPDFFANKQHEQWNGTPVWATGPQHEKGSMLQTVGSVVDVRATPDGRAATFAVEFLDTPEARTAEAVVERFGGACSIEADWMLKGRDVVPEGVHAKGVALLMRGWQSDPNALVEVAMSRAELSLLQTETQDNKDGTSMATELETKLASELTAAKAELAKANDAIAKIDAEKKETEHTALHKEVAELAKELGEPEPKADASVADLATSKQALGIAKGIATRKAAELAKAGAEPQSQGTPKVEEPAAKPTAMDRLFRISH